MKGCPWEDRVEAAVNDARLDADVGTHLEDCADCRALAATIRALRIDGEAAERGAAARLPDAGVIFAEFGTRTESRPAGDRAAAAVHDALRAVVMVEVIAAAVAAFVTLGAAAWGIRRLGSVAGLDFERLFQFGNGGGGNGEFGGTALVAAAAVILIAALQGVLGLRLDSGSDSAGL